MSVIISMFLSAKALCTTRATAHNLLAVKTFVKPLLGFWRNFRSLLGLELGVCLRLDRFRSGDRFGRSVIIDIRVSFRICDISINSVIA